MKIPVPDVPDELTLKQIAELWAAESEPTEVEILDRFRSAFWLGAFEDDLEDSYLSRVLQKTGHRGPPLPAEPWNRRRALGTLPPIQGVPLPSKPELLSPVARTFQVIIDPALWGILASLERGRFDKYFHALLESFTVSRKDFCQVADRQDWGRPQFWDGNETNESSAPDPTVDGPIIEVPELEPEVSSSRPAVLPESTTQREKRKAQTSAKYAGFAIRARELKKQNPDYKKADLKRLLEKQQPEGPGRVSADTIERALNDRHQDWAD